MDMRQRKGVASKRVRLRASGKAKKGERRGINAFELTRYYRLLTTKKYRVRFRENKENWGVTVEPQAFGARQGPGIEVDMKEKKVTCCGLSKTFEYMPCFTCSA